MDARLVSGVALKELRVVSADPERTRAVHALRGIDVPIEAGTESRRVVVLDSPRGPVEIGESGAA